MDESLSPPSLTKRMFGDSADEDEILTPGQRPCPEPAPTPRVNPANPQPPPTPTDTRAPVDTTTPSTLRLLKNQSLILSLSRLALVLMREEPR